MKAVGGVGRELEKRQGPACSWEPPRAVPVRMGVYVWGGSGTESPWGKPRTEAVLPHPLQLEVAGKVSDLCCRLRRAEQV